MLRRPCSPKSGLLTTVAWSSDFDSRLVAAGGTLANLAASIVLWIALRKAKSASVRWRFFLLTSFAFNLFEGTGYFLFSGVTNFGDWAEVIAGLPAHWLWRALLVVVGMASYFGAVLAVGIANSAVRWSSEERISSLAETHTHSLLFNADSCVHSRSLEPDWYPIGVAICPACNGGREVWASVVEVLHSERNRSQAATRWH